MGNPKRQHWIPKSILRFFEDEMGQVAFFDKSNPHLGVHKRNKSSIFWRKHNYTLVHEDGTRDYSIENNFARDFDNRIGVLVSRRLVISYSSLRCGITRSDRSELLAFCLNLLVRNPKTQSFVETSGAYRAAHSVLALANSLQRQSSLTIASQTKKLLLHPDDTHDLTIDFLGGFGCHFMMPDDLNRSFVIGSLPICRFEPTEEEWRANPFGQSKQKFGFFVPLAPHLGFFLSGCKNSDFLIRVPSQLVDKVNAHTASQSDSVAAQNETEIHSVLQKIN